jgi:hypothetical protein
MVLESSVKSLLVNELNSAIYDDDYEAAIDVVYATLIKGDILFAKFLASLFNYQIIKSEDDEDLVIPA